jgi:hypothetical protein
MGRPCTICESIDNTRLAAEMIAAGASDQAIADRIGGVHRMAVNRHRRSHVMVPASALAQVAAQAEPATHDAPRPAAFPEGAPALPVASASLVAPTATAPQDIVNAALGAPRQAEKLVRIENRLERMATLAEQNGSPGQVAAIATAQLRAVETGAKLAGVGGFAPQKADGGGNQPVFSLTFVFPDRPAQTIDFAAVGQAPAIPSEAEGSGSGALADGGAFTTERGEDIHKEMDEWAAPPSLDLTRLAAAFGHPPVSTPAEQPPMAPAPEQQSPVVQLPGFGRAALAAFYQGTARP